MFISSRQEKNMEWFSVWGRNVVGENTGSYIPPVKSQRYQGNTLSSSGLVTYGEEEYPSSDIYGQSPDVMHRRRS